MIGTLRSLVVLAPAPRWRLVLSIGLGALAVIFGIGLMATAGYLISRAAERPAILSLTGAIVAVRFFALARPLTRYLERLASHDLAFRVLARIRVRFYERIEPLAPAGLEAYRQGDLVNRMVGDVDALQSLYLRGSLLRSSQSRPEPWQSEWRPRSFRSRPRSSPRDCSSRDSRCRRLPGALGDWQGTAGRSPRDI